jgi:hypothetical protein
VSVSACPGPNSRFKRLRYGGICVSCGSRIAREETGWHDPDVKKVTCKACWNEDAPLIQPEAKAVRNVVGGSSTLKWSEQGHRRNRRKGAAGEYVMDRHLHRELQNGEIILNDCQIPNGRGNIDHIVVASSGVWVIDTKNWAGTIEYRNVGGITRGHDRLLVDQEDRTHLVDDIYAQVIPIASLIGDHSIPIHPAIVFINGSWSAGVLRILANRPYKHLGVWITWPKALSAKIVKQGPLLPEMVDKIGAQLRQELASM